MKRKFTYFLMLASLIACNSNTSVDKTDVMADTDEVNVLEDYTKIELPLTNLDSDIHVPGKKLTSATPEIFKNNAGVTHLKVGENFHLEITEQKTDIEMLVNDLNQDIFYKTNVISKTDDEIIFEKTLPDGSKSFVHFCKLINADDQNITIKSAITGQFRRSHIDRMLKSANSFTTTTNNQLLSSTPK